MYEDGVDDGSLAGLRITSGWMELHTNFSEPAHDPRVRSENTLQLRPLSWIPTHHPAGTKEAHIDLVCAGNEREEKTGR